MAVSTWLILVFLVTIAIALLFYVVCSIAYVIRKVRRQNERYRFELLVANSPDLDLTFDEGSPTDGVESIL